MSLNFVKSSILSSSDGIDFNSETLLDSEEAKRSREAASKGYVKPLYLQLAERKAEEEEARDKVLKLNRAQPPVILGEDDVQFINEAIDKQRLIHKQTEEDIKDFKLKKEATKLLQEEESSKKISTTSSYFSFTSKASFAPTPTLPFIKITKRKRTEVIEDEENIIKKEKKEEVKVEELIVKKIEEEKEKPSTYPLDLFSAYASDSE